MSPSKRFLYILLLTAMWSPSFLFIKIIIQEIPTLTTIALRVTLAAIALLIILKLKKRSLPTDLVFWGHSAAMAFLCSVLPFYLFAYAEQYIDSAMASILNGTTPMFTAFFAHFLIPSDRLSLQKTIGIALSITGTALLFLPNMIHSFPLEGEVVSNHIIMGLTAGAFAALSYALSHIYAKKYLTKQTSSLVVPTAQILLSACMLLPLALLIDRPHQLPIPSVEVILSILSLAFIGTVAAFIIYYKLLEHCGPTAVSMVACFFPLGGILLGHLVLGEALESRDLVAAGLIIAGVFVVNEVVKLPYLKETIVPEKS